MARVRLQVLGVAWLALSACGGLYRRSGADDEPPAGSGGTGGTDVFVPGGAGAVPGGIGSGGVGPGGVGPGGVGAGGLALGGNAPSAGAAGAVTCDLTRVTSLGRPRPDGPTAYMGCGMITDDDLRQRFVDFDARVPKGLFYESPPGVGYWRPACARSAGDLQLGGGPDGMGTFLGSGSSQWQYSATFCSRGRLLTQSAVRCDYFDGVKLSETDPSNYPLFASLLWWRDNSNLSGAAILGYSVQIGNATDVVELCTLSGTQGDFGLCDQLELYSVKYRITFGGEVTPEKPVLLRTVQGKCR